MVVDFGPAGCDDYCNERYGHDRAKLKSCIDICNKVSEAVEECLGKRVDNYSKYVTNCDLIRKRRFKKGDGKGIAGLYVFFDHDKVYYVGETDDMIRRVGNEHCNAHIAGSKYVARFLIYHLLTGDDIYEKINDGRGKLRVIPSVKSVKEIVEEVKKVVKEADGYIKEVLMREIGVQGIFMVICEELRGGEKRSLRKSLEKCIVERLEKAGLGPILNYEVGNEDDKA